MIIPVSVCRNITDKNQEVFNRGEVSFNMSEFQSVFTDFSSKTEL